MVRYDASRIALDWIRQRNPSVLYIDFIDDRFDIIDTGHGLILESSEFIASKIMRSRFKGGRRIERLSDECLALWQAAMESFAEWMKENAPNTHIILHRARFQTSIKHPDHIEAWPSTLRIGRNLVEVDAINRMMLRYCDITTACLRNVHPIEAAAAHQVSAHEHEWGPHPVHYVPNYYRDCLRQIESIQASLPGLQSAFPAA